MLTGVDGSGTGESAQDGLSKETVNALCRGHDVLAQFLNLFIGFIYLFSHLASSVDKLSLSRSDAHVILELGAAHPSSVIMAVLCVSIQEKPLCVTAVLYSSFLFKK